MAKNIRLYSNLRSLSETDFNRFVDFVNASFVSIHRETQMLLAALAAYSPGFKVEDETLFEQAFPHKPYNNARLRILRTYLLGHFNDFVVWNELKNREDLKGRLLIGGLDKMGLRKEAENQLSKLWAASEKEETVTLKSYFHTLKLRELEVDLSIRKGDESPLSSIWYFLEDLDTYYLAYRLRMLSALLDLSKIQSQEIAPQLYQSTLELTEQVDLRNPLLVDLYGQILRLQVSNEQDSEFELLRETVQNHGSKLERTEQQNVYGFLINHCLHANAKGKAGYLEKAFEVYQEVLELGLLFGEDAFAAQNYKILVSMGVRLGKFEWTRNFLENNRENFPEKWRKGLYHYGHAYLDFALGNFRSAKKHLLQVEFHSWNYRASHQNLLVRIYFETDDLEGFESLSKSFQRYIYRSKEIAPHMRESLLNLIRFCQKMFDLRMQSPSSKQLDNLRDEVMVCPQLQNRDWILAKLEEMS